MKLELSKIMALNEMLQGACAATPDRVYGLYCGLVHEAIAPAVKAYSDQMREARSAEVQQYDRVYAEWSRAHDGQRRTPELSAEVAALQVEHGVIDELVTLDEIARKLGEEEVEVTMPQIPIHVIPANTASGIVLNFMTFGCISVEAAQAFLDKSAAKEAKKDEGTKGPTKPKKVK
jgi:hypothetical protein